MYLRLPAGQQITFLSTKPNKNLVRIISHCLNLSACQTKNVNLTVINLRQK